MNINDILEAGRDVVYSPFLKQGFMVEEYHLNFIEKDSSSDTFMFNSDIFKQLCGMFIENVTLPETIKDAKRVYVDSRKVVFPNPILSSIACAVWGYHLSSGSPPSTIMAINSSYLRDNEPATITQRIKNILIDAAIERREFTNQEKHELFIFKSIALNDYDVLRNSIIIGSTGLKQHGYFAVPNLSFLLEVIMTNTLEHLRVVSTSLNARPLDSEELVVFDKKHASLDSDFLRENPDSSNIKLNNYIGVDDDGNLSIKTSPKAISLWNPDHIIHDINTTTLSRDTHRASINKFKELKYISSEVNPYTITVRLEGDKQLISPPTAFAPYRFYLSKTVYFEYDKDGWVGSDCGFGVHENSYPGIANSKALWTLYYDPKGVLSDKDTPEFFSEANAITLSSGRFKVGTLSGGVFSIDADLIRTIDNTKPVNPDTLKVIRKKRAHKDINMFNKNFLEGDIKNIIVAVQAMDNNLIESLNAITTKNKTCIFCGNKFGSQEHITGNNHALFHQHKRQASAVKSILDNKTKQSGIPSYILYTNVLDEERMNHEPPCTCASIARNMIKRGSVIKVPLEIDEMFTSYRMIHTAVQHMSNATQLGQENRTFNSNKQYGIYVEFVRTLHTLAFHTPKAGIPNYNVPINERYLTLDKTQQ